MKKFTIKYNDEIIVLERDNVNTKEKAVIVSMSDRIEEGKNYSVDTIIDERGKEWCVDDDLIFNRL